MNAAPTPSAAWCKHRFTTGCVRGEHEPLTSEHASTAADVTLAATAAAPDAPLSPQHIVTSCRLGSCCTLAPARYSHFYDLYRPRDRASRHVHRPALHHPCLPPAPHCDAGRARTMAARHWHKHLSAFTLNDEQRRHLPPRHVSLQPAATCQKKALAAIDTGALQARITTAQITNKPNTNQV